jgi:hypothetical protein
MRKRFQLSGASVWTGGAPSGAFGPCALMRCNTPRRGVLYPLWPVLALPVTRTKLEWMAPGTLCRSFVLLVSLVLAGCLQAHSQVNYRIDNHLERCIEPVASQTTWVRGVLVLELRYRQRQPTARCGCTSALVAYSSYADAPGGRRWLASASLTPAHNDLVTLPLAVDRDLLGDASVLVSLGCDEGRSPDFRQGVAPRPGPASAPQPQRFPGNGVYASGGQLSQLLPPQ